jgi:hypothetical protein
MNSVTVQLLLTILSIASSIASIWGLYVALRAIRESKEQTTKLTDLVNSQTIAQEALSRVSNSLSTRYVGIHPEYLDEVKRLVETARSSLLIMSSVPGFGIFSAVRGWEKLRAELMQAKMRVPITLLTGTEASRVERLRLQFGPAYSNWGLWLNQDDNRKKLEEFCTCYGVVVPESGQARWLERELIAINNEIREKVYRGGIKSIVKTTDDFLPVIAWIADGRRAVFAFSNQHGKFPGFYTEDPYIIESLTGFASRLLETPA